MADRFGNDDPQYAFDSDPTEIVKSVLMQGFDNGQKWNVYHVAPLSKTPTITGFVMTLLVKWFEAPKAGLPADKGYHTARIRVECFREE